MQSGFYTKTGTVVNYLSRTLYLMPSNQKIPTIENFTTSLNVSRGMIQKALKFLEDNKCIELSRLGKLGTILLKKNQKKLLEYTGWEHITGSIPLPLNEHMATLASSIDHVFQNMPINFIFAYITGGTNRLKFLLNGGIDFIVVSKKAGIDFCNMHNEIEIAVELTDSIYSNKYILIANDKTKTCIEDNMKIAIDYTCYEQVYYTEILCKGVDVEYVQIPYTDARKALANNIVDCAVFRNDKSVDHLNKINLPFVTDDTTIPVVLTRKDNLAISQLIRKFLSPNKIAKLQKDKQTNTFIAKFL